MVRIHKNENLTAALLLVGVFVVLEGLRCVIYITSRGYVAVGYQLRLAVISWSLVVDVKKSAPGKIASALESAFRR